MKINKKNTLNFKKYSKDNNKIHYNNNYASKFFFKEPIVHGVNAVLLGLSYFSSSQKKKFLINSLNINFQNFILINEEFKIKLIKKNILVFNSLNEKIKIDLDFSYLKDQFDISPIAKRFNIKNIINYQIIKELLFITKYIGSQFPGNGSLIHKINIFKTNQITKFKKVKKKKILENIFNLKYSRENLKVEVLVSKIKPFLFKQAKLNLSKKIQQNLKNKNILVFGKSSDLAKRIDLLNQVKGCNIYKYSFRVNLNNPTISKAEYAKLKKSILSIKPDYIFYLSSPKIYSGSKKNKLLLKFYISIYLSFFKKLISIILNSNLKTKIFYPSSIALNDKKKYKRLDCYIHVKKLAEKFCSKSENKKIVKVFRLPQFKSRSNYNLLGHYEGKEITKFDKYMEFFFKNFYH